MQGKALTTLAYFAYRPFVNTKVTNKHIGQRIRNYYQPTSLLGFYEAIVDKHLVEGGSELGISWSESARSINLATQYPGPRCKTDCA